jgi:glyoxalase superfamily protein
MAMRLVQIAMNARDDSAVGLFWAEALGWGVSSEEPGVTSLEPVSFAYPDPVAVCIDVLAVPEPKTVKNRVHIDLATTSADCPIAANDLEPSITAAIPTASSPASGCRRARFFRGSGTWARRSRRYRLQAAGIGEDVIGGRASLAAGDGERENFHRSARALPATRRHTGDAEEIQRRREETGFSYFVFGADFADTLAAVVAKLAGR